MIHPNLLPPLIHVTVKIRTTAHCLYPRFSPNRLRGLLVPQPLPQQSITEPIRKPIREPIRELIPSISNRPSEQRLPLNGRQFHFNPDESIYRPREPSQRKPPRPTRVDRYGIYQ